MNSASNRPSLRRRKPVSFRGADLGDHGGEFAGRKLRDRLQVAAVFVAEREVVDQVFDGFEAFGLKHGGARRADAFEVCERGIEREGQSTSLAMGGEARRACIGASVWLRPGGC